MIKIENTEVHGWSAAIRGARNPKNSWDKSDTSYGTGSHYDDQVGPRDMKLLRTLAFAGPDHGKFLRMITVTMDVTAPLYWWKEFDTYKIGTTANSCSTMHKIDSRDLTMDDFSHEHLLTYEDVTWGEVVPTTTLKAVIVAINVYRAKYKETGDKKYWWQMIQLLPTSYNQRRTISLNYAVLRAQYHARKNHKLDEWHDYCRWIESLPHSELITGGDTHV